MRTRPARFFGDRKTLAPAATAGTLLAAALVAGLGIAFTNAEGLVAKGFTTALSAASVSQSGGTGDEALVAGSEEFWLDDPAKAGNVGQVQPAAWSPLPAALGVEIGDRITINSGSDKRTLEVVAVAEVPAKATRRETGKALGHQVLVTCRDMSGDQEGGQLVRFVTYTGEARSGAAAKPLRTL